MALADDAVPEVRMVVARVLGEIGPETAGAFAAERKLTSDPDLYIQARAITALGNFPGDHVASCPLLYRAYLSKQRPLQEGAELSLEKIIKSKQFNASAARQGKDAALRFAATFGLNPNSDAGFQAAGADAQGRGSGGPDHGRGEARQGLLQSHRCCLQGPRIVGGRQGCRRTRPDASLPGGPDAETVEAVRAVNGSAQV